MCGIAGFIDFARETDRPSLTAAAARMTAAIAHRGPDDEGFWADERHGVALGFRRLAILDLSPAGRQPMASASGRFTIVFNGEIYNFSELREELEEMGHKFKGHSDTEVMLAGFEEWGIEPAVKRLNGMFAIAVWDAVESELFLIRDRVGKKPLYFGTVNDIFFFGSELKSFLAHPAFVRSIDAQSLRLYLKFGYVPAPGSIYENVSKLSPGSMVKIAPGRREIGDQRAYWSVEEAAARGIDNPLDGSEEEISAALEKLLSDSVRRRMIADVPLGAFLSGGIDSSLIAALMQANSSRPVQTFSIGFQDREYNEAEHAKRVAEHLGTDHTELYVTPEEALEVVPELPAIYDEPFADSSQIPTYLVSKLARRDVTVALSGDGGDELFGGYGRYETVSSLWSAARKIPRVFRPAATASVAFSGSIAGLVAKKSHSRRSGLAEKLARLSELLPSEDLQSFYNNFVAAWPEPELLMVERRPNGMVEHRDFQTASNPIQSMMLADARQYLPDDILVKVDRASMRVSLEVRAPLLDYRVVEFAWRVPFGLKVKNGESKWLLKELLYRYVPREIAERPKMGFDVPIADWLRGDLRDWAEELIGEKRLKAEGIFDPAPIRRAWRDHLERWRNNQQALWTILMFQAWNS